MEIKDISKLNYFGNYEYLEYDYLEQCIGNKSEKIKFNNGYKSLLKSGFNANDNVSCMLSDFLDNSSKEKFFDFVGGINEYVKISPYHIIFGLATFLLQCNNLDEEKRQFNASDDGVLENITKAYKKLLKSMMKKIDGYDDLYALQSDFVPLNMLYEAKRTVKERTIPIVSMQSYKQDMKECLTNLLSYTNYMVDYFLSYGLRLSDFNSFDYNKYMFIIFSSKLESLKNVTGSYNEIYPLITYLNETSDKENTDLYFYKYNSKTDKYDIKYSYKDFLADAYSYIKNNPQFNFDIIPTGFFDGWESDDINEFLDMYTDDSDKNFEVVDPEYIFLPSGTRNSNGKQAEKDNKSKNNDSMIRLAIEKRSFYDKNRDKIHKVLLGKNKFKGYVANVLDNGYVIFEKYDIANGCLSNKSGAAYIMNIDNFNSLSSKDIQEIRRIVREQSSDLPVYQKINYVCHSGNWQEKLQAYFDQYTGIKKEDIDKVVVNSSDRNLQDNKKVIYTKQG